MSSCCDNLKNFDCPSEIEFFNSFKRLLPEGLLWQDSEDENPVFHQTLKALSSIFYEQQKRICAIRNDKIPPLATGEALRSWWNIEPCLDFNYFETDDEKRDWLGFLMETSENCGKIYFLNQAFEKLGINVSIERLEYQCNLTICDIIDICERSNECDCASNTVGCMTAGMRLDLCDTNYGKCFYLQINTPAFGDEFWSKEDKCSGRYIVNCFIRTYIDYMPFILNVENTGTYPTHGIPTCCNFFNNEVLDVVC